MNPLSNRLAGTVCVMTVALLLPAAWAQTGGGAPAVDATVQANQAARAAQTRIDALDDQTRAALERYRAALWQAQQLKVYAEQVEPLLATQEAERASLAAQARELAESSRDITPLLLRMLDGLDKFVALDLPFLQTERRERVAALKRLMTDPATPSAEKYRRILEAYRIEGDYGRGFGAERIELDDKGAKKVVDVLRVGRTALYSLTLDGREAGYWDAAAKQWKPLSGSYRSALREGLKIARETAAPVVVTLPVPAPAALAAAPARSTP
ncbi:MAG: DUF3450 domain-containing protein [Nevskia sp.]